MTKEEFYLALGMLAEDWDETAQECHSDPASNAYTDCARELRGLVEEYFEEAAR